MNTSLIQFKDQFIERMGFLGTLFGFSKLLGQIYGTLFLSPSPLCLNDLMKELRVSKGSISTNIRELEKWGGCKKVWVKGEARKDYYEAVTDFKAFLNKRLMDAVKRRVHTVTEITDSAKILLGSPSPKDSSEDKVLASFYNKRIDQINSIRKKIDFLITALSKLI